MEWIISANCKKYDVVSAFKELPYVDWKQKANYSIGDKVFVYSTSPISAIEFLVEVVAINLNIGEIVDDKKYWLDLNEYEIGEKCKKYVRFKMIRHYTNTKISLDKLHSKGLAGVIRTPRKLYDSHNNLLSWAKYIHDTLDSDSNKWDSFITEAFQNKLFSAVFHKSNVTDRSYYDLLCDDSFFHLVARNTSKQSIEVYIEDNVPFYCFLVNNIDVLKEDITEEIDLYTIAEKRNLKHRKLIIYYNDKTINFNDWLISRALILKQNVEQLEKEYFNEINQYIMNEDNCIKEYISTVSTFPTSFKYSQDAVLAPVLTEINVYRRDRQKSINSLVHANFKCEIDNKHYCFMRKDGKTPYTEAHHLIPLSYQCKFKYSLDIEENIVSLCSNCHNEIHYGANAKTLIEKLYYDRFDLLRKKKINISLDELLSYYGY